MGSVGLGNNAALGAFNSRIFTEGLDLGRCSIKEALGIYVADPANSFRAGMLVGRTAAGLVIPAAGATEVLGVAKWNHTTTMYAAVTDEPLVMTGTVTQYLKHPLVVVDSEKVSLTAGGAALTDDTDYTLTESAGTIVRIPGQAIGDGVTVYVSYTFQVVESDLLQIAGKNFWNSMDEVSQADGRVTVITDAELLFTSQYDTSKVYTLTGATSNLYASAAKPGLFTSTNEGGSTIFVGRVFQVPTASDPFLGVRMIKTPAVGA